MKAAMHLFSLQTAHVIFLSLALHEVPPASTQASCSSDMVLNSDVPFPLVAVPKILSSCTTGAPVIFLLLSACITSC